MELKVYVNGVQRVVCGISETTTCQDIIYALAHATGRTGRFALIEKWRTSERSLSPQDQPLKILEKWGDYAADVQFFLRCLDEKQFAGVNTPVSLSNAVAPPLNVASQLPTPATAWLEASHGRHSDALTTRPHSVTKDPYPGKASCSPSSRTVATVGKPSRGLSPEAASTSSVSAAANLHSNIPLKTNDFTSPSANNSRVRLNQSAGDTSCSSLSSVFLNHSFAELANANDVVGQSRQIPARIKTNDFARSPASVEKRRCDGVNERSVQLNNSQNAKGLNSQDREETRRRMPPSYAQVMKQRQAVESGQQTSSSPVIVSHRRRSSNVVSSSQTNGDVTHLGPQAVLNESRPSVQQTIAQQDAVLRQQQKLIADLDTELRLCDDQESLLVAEIESMNRVIQQLEAESRPLRQHLALLSPQGAVDADAIRAETLRLQAEADVARTQSAELRRKLLALNGEIASVAHTAEKLRSKLERHCSRMGAEMPHSAADDLSALLKQADMDQLELDASLQRTDDEIRRVEALIGLRGERKPEDSAPPSIASELKPNAAVDSLKQSC